MANFTAEDKHAHAWGVHKMNKTIAAIAITLALAGSAFAQEPTYEQTQKWVVERISTNAGTQIPNVISESYEQVSMAGCLLTYTTNTFYPSLDGKSNQITSAVPLAKISTVELRVIPASTIPAQYQVRLHVDEAFAVTTVEKDGKGNVINKSAELYHGVTAIVFTKSSATDADMAARMQKALSHAVDLCKKNPPKEVF